MTIKYDVEDLNTCGGQYNDAVLTLTRDITIKNSWTWCKCLGLKHRWPAWSQLVAIGIKDATPISKWNKVAQYNFARGMKCKNF